MIRSKMTRTAVIGLGVVAAPLAIAIASPGAASADPGLCVSGPWGYAYACVDVPNWPGYWYDGPHWRGHGHGDWDDDWDDD